MGVRKNFKLLKHEHIIYNVALKHVIWRFQICNYFSEISLILQSVYSIETFSTIYTTSFAYELENMSPDDYNSLADSAVLIKEFLLKLFAPLVKPFRKKKLRQGIY